MATVDHYVPLKRGGADTLSNMVLACFRCNHAKDDMTPEQFAEVFEREVGLEPLFLERVAKQAPNTWISYSQNQRERTTWKS